MIFLGDIASPSFLASDSLCKVFSNNPLVFSEKRIICNFEGLIYDGPEMKSNEPILYNHPSVLNFLNQEKKPILCLANNHILDLPEQFESTINLINAGGIKYCGAGTSMKEADKPVSFSEGTSNFMLFNACWDFLLYNHRNPRSGIYVAELKEERLINLVREHKEASPESSIIVYLHWSLDMETLPFPMYRQFSRALVNSGADIVIGSHSHCVQGGEKYKSGYIIYGLGNFFIPNESYAKGKLEFPDFAKIELALEWDKDGNKVQCYWFKYQNKDDQHQIEFIGLDDFETSERLKAFSPYQGMSDDEYLHFFKTNRRKKRLIPVYRDFRKIKRNTFYTNILKSRARVAHLLAKSNLIKWQN